MDISENLLKVERQNCIRKIVEQKGLVTTVELSSEFDVSELTIRRDLEELDEPGVDPAHTWRRSED